MTKPLETPFRRKIKARDAAIKRDYDKLIQQPGAMAGGVDRQLMKKYGLYTRKAIWAARKRAEKELLTNNI